MLTQARFRLGAFSIDLTARRISNESGEVRLRPKSFDLLAQLVRARGRFHSYDELESQLWANVKVSRNSIAQCISEIQRSLGPGTIETLRGRGVRLAITPEPEAAPAQSAADGADTGSALLVLVLPSGLEPATPREDPRMEPIFEDLCDELSLYWRVLDPAFARSLDATRMDPHELHQGVGVDYVISGSIRREEGELRIRARIVDAKTREIAGTTQLYSKTVERLLPGLATDLGGLLGHRIASLLGAHLARRHTTNQSMDRVHHAILRTANPTRTRMRELRAQLSSARPDEHNAHVAAARAILSYADFWSPREQCFADTVRAIDSAAEAIPEDHPWRPTILGSHSYLCAWSGRPDLAPAPAPVVAPREFPEEIGLAGISLLLRGRLPEAVDHLQRLRRATPGHPLMAPALVDLAHAQALSGDLEEARATSWRAAADNPNFPRVFPCIAAIASALGRDREAMDALARCRPDAGFATVRGLHAAKHQPVEPLYSRAAERFKLTS